MRMLLHCSDPWSNLPSFAKHIPAIASPCQVKPRTLQVPEYNLYIYISIYSISPRVVSIPTGCPTSNPQTFRLVLTRWGDIPPAASGASTVPYPASRRAAWPSWPKAKVPRGDAIQRAGEPWIQRAIARQNHRDSMCICGCFIFVCVYVYLSLCARVLKRYACTCMCVCVCVCYILWYIYIYIYIYIYMLYGSIWVYSIQEFVAVF